MARRDRQRLVQLEAARGFAALYVVVYHAGVLHGSRLQVLLSFGQEAVMLFFLISGFVIYYSTFSRGEPPSFAGYLYGRAKRIWPMFLLSLAFSYAALSIQRHTTHVLGWRLLAGNLVMLQDNATLKPGVWFDTFGNSALWSLSYEWWFYMLFFPIAVRLLPVGSMQLWCAFILSVLGCLTYEIAPNQICIILGYFFLWWCGAECGRQYVRHGRVTMRGQLRTLILLAVMACLWSIPAAVALVHSEHLRWGIFPVLPARHFVSALVLLCAGIAWAQFGCPGFRYTLLPLASLAPISYALYLFHLPILGALQATLPIGVTLRLALAFMLLVPLCYILEVKVQAALGREMDRVWARMRTTAVRDTAETAYVADRA